jgi:hypothetical protein
MKHDSLGRVALPDVAGPPALGSFLLAIPPAPLATNASTHLLLEADVRDERTLEAVRRKPWFGQDSGRSPYQKVVRSSLGAAN